MIIQQPLGSMTMTVDDFILSCPDNQAIISPTHSLPSQPSLAEFEVKKKRSNFISSHLIMAK